MCVCGVLTVDRHCLATTRKGNLIREQLCVRYSVIPACRPETAVWQLIYYGQCASSCFCVCVCVCVCVFVHHRVADYLCYKVSFSVDLRCI